jgi:hypothetical protein
MNALKIGIISQMRDRAGGENTPKSLKKMCRIACAHPMLRKLFPLGEPAILP